VKLRAMVLQFEPALGNCRWVDFASRHKSQRTLIAALQAGVIRGEWHAWRLITIHKEIFGKCEVGDDEASL
jgi:hypothetical protein